MTQFIRGVQENSAIATAKHFPGHGNVSVDSHLALASVPGSREQLESAELVPFRAAIAAGVDSIMPGHLAVPIFEPDPNVPATLSHNILTGLLRDEMKFRGLIVTDAMDMGGVTRFIAPGEAAVRSVEAGADVLLMPPLPDAAMAGLENAVSSGRISVARIDESVRRILTAKARIGLDKQRLVDVPRLNEKFGLPAFDQDAQRIADRGVTLLRDTPKLLPLDSTRPLRVLLVALSADPDPFPAETLEPEIRPRVDSLTVLRADTQFRSVNTLKLPDPSTYDVAIAALFVRVADRKGNVGFPEDQRAFIDQLLAAGKPTVVAGFGSPYLIERFPNAPTWLAEFATNDVSQRAAGRALVRPDRHCRTNSGHRSRHRENRRWDASRGKSDGRFSPLPPRWSHQLKPAYDLLDQAVADGAFPGGVLAVGWNNELAVHPFGKFARDPKSPAVTANAIYDVASLTKSIVTTTAIMSLVQRGELDLDAPVGRFLPEWAKAAKSDPNPAWRSRATVRMLLLHDSGLPAHRDFFKDAKGHDAVLAQALATPLVREPGTQIEYSDIGFILLGEISERLTGDPLDETAKDIFAPLRMNDSMFNPPKNVRSKIAPTEDDASYRKRLLQGEVDDENAWAMGGVAGHAGLFSTAGISRLRADAAQWRHVRALPDAPASDDPAIHRAPHDWRFRARFRLGRACAALLFRRVFLLKKLRPPRLHRHLAVDRPGAQPVRSSAHESRESHPCQRKDTPGAARSS